MKDNIERCLDHMKYMLSIRPPGRNEFEHDVLDVLTEMKKQIDSLNRKQCNCHELFD